jgi:hypothetical protein
MIFTQGQPEGWVNPQKIVIVAIFLGNAGNDA